MSASPYLSLIGKRQPAPGLAYALAENKLALADAGGLRTAVDPNTMSASFVITDETPDRVGDVVIARGISLNNFRRNPVGFFNHQQYPLPIGKWEDPQGRCTIRIEDKRATGTLYFSQKSKEAAQVFDLVSEDILRATSIGFNPLEEPQPRRRGEPNPNSIEAGLIFPRIDLLEVSVVGVPANPGASRLRGWIEHNHPSPQLKAALLPWCEPKPVWSPGIGPGEKEATMTAKAKKGRKGKTCTDTPVSVEAKAMEESSGTDGGYVADDMVDAGERQDHDAEAGAARGHVVDMVRAVMDHHSGEAHPDGPHEAHVSEDGKNVHHVHNPDADASHLQIVKDDLSKIDGVDGVTQGHEPPSGEGYTREFPGEEGAELDGSTQPDEVDAEEEPPDETGEEKCSKCGCGRKRAKSMSPDDGEDDDDMVTKDEPGGTAVVSAPLPHGAASAQHLIEYIEGCIAEAEPECREFFETILEQCRDWASERYPEIPFGGEEEDEDGAADDEAGESEEEEMEDEADSRNQVREAMDEYRGATPLWRKRYMSRNKLKVVKDAADHLGDLAEMEHGSEITRTHKAACAFHAKSLHGLLKGATGFDESDPEPNADQPDFGKAEEEAAAWAQVSESLAGLNGKLDVVSKQVLRTTGRGL